MKALTPTQIRQLQAHLREAGASNAQVNTLLPHLISEVEHFMWIGLPFEAALHKVQLEADFNPVTYLHGKHGETLVADDDPEPQTLTDMVFSDRNRAYGAYDLRKSYDRALINAMVMTFGIVLLVLSVMYAWRQGHMDYLSWSGIAWVVGIMLVFFAGFRFYLEQVAQREEQN
jgi:cation transport ATPase